MTKSKKKAPVFSKDELVNNAHIFGTSPELMAGALHGTEEATKDEAFKLLKEFKSKGV